LFLNMSGGVVAQENVVVVRFAEPSRAYQALSVLKECQAEGKTPHLMTAAHPAMGAADE
jgi:hypothetical protein